MVAVNQFVDEVVVRARSEGVKETTSDLDKLTAAETRSSDANERTAAANEKATRARQTAAQALDKLQRLLDAEYRMTRQMEQAQALLNRAWEQGAISAGRHADLLRMADGQYSAAAAGANRLATANENHAKSSTIAAYQLRNLGYQLNDVATMALSGSSAFQILATQGGQVAQILGETGVGAAVRGVGSAIGRFITPTTATVGLLTGAAVLGYGAWSRYDDLTRSVSTTLQGLGRQVGLTTADFEKLTATAAAGSGLSSRQGLSLGQAYAAGGQIGPENVACLIKVSKDAAATFGVSLDDVKEKLTSAFSSPAGIERLNEQLRFLDARTLSLVQSLFRQGKEQEGIALAIDRLPPSLAKAETAQGAVARAWEAIKNAASDADTAVGKAIDRIVKGPSPQQRLADLKAQVEYQQGAEAERLVQPGSVSRSYVPPTAPTVASTQVVPQEQVQTVKDYSTALTEALEKKAALMRQEEADARSRAVEESLIRRSNELKAYMRELAPGSDEYRKMKDNDEAFQSVLRSGNKELITRTGSTKDFEEAASIARQAMQSMTSADGERMTAAERANRLNDVAVAGVRARTVEDRASVAVREQVERQRGQGITGAQAEAQAEHAAQMIREQADQQLRDRLRDQGLEANEIRARIGLIGQDAEARAVGTARRRTENELTREGIDINGGLARSVVAGAEANARLQVSYDRAAEAQQKLIEGQRELASEFSGFVTDILSGGQKIGAAFDTLAKNLSGNAIKALLTGEGPFAGLLGTANPERGQVGGLLSGRFMGLFGGGSDAAGSPLPGAQGPSRPASGLFGDLFNTDKIADALGLGAESGLGAAAREAFKPRTGSAGQSLGFFSSPLGGSLAGAGAGAALGYSSQSPLVGAAGGALAGFMATGGNPVGALVGGAAGLAGGAYGHPPSRKKDREHVRRQHLLRFA